MSGSAQSTGLLSALKTVLEIVVVAFFITTFIAQPFRIPSSSMEPTLRIGDFVLVDKQTFTPADGPAWLLPPAAIERGDMAVFHWPVEPGTYLVKRVIGMPGDRLRLHRSHVWIDGHPIAEPYAFYSPSRPNSFRDEFPSLREADPNMEPAWWAALRGSIRDGELIVPPGHYFVLGDNRNDSDDSRYWGFVPRAAIVGRPALVYFAVQPDAPAANLPARIDAAIRFGIHRARILH